MPKTSDARPAVCASVPNHLKESITMTTQPKSAAPEAAHPTHHWRDTLVFMGAVVLLTLVGLALVINVATLL
jgi:hypothetical protein